MTQLSLAEAKRLSIIKWQMIVDNDGHPVKKHEFSPEVFNCLFQCGFCERWKHPDGLDCRYCELGKVAGTCNDEGDYEVTIDKIIYTREPSLYYKWLYFSSDSHLKYAKQILEIIKSIEV